MGKVPESPPESGARLTERDYWDAMYRGTAPAAEEAGSESSNAVSKPGWKRAISEAIRRCGGDSYGQDWFWNRLLPQFVGRQPGRSVLEVGAAPGEEVLRFRDCFGYQPFGLEYTPAGVEATRRNFASRGADPDNVIEGDVFDEELTGHYASRFDVVFSRGFIEHFTDPKPAVAQHARLTKPGGLVVISIPTLTGIHQMMTRILTPYQIPLHNLNIMRLDEFRSLFEGAGLEELYCNYAGGVNLLVSYTSNASGYRRTVQDVAMKLQVLANMAGRTGLLRGRYLNCALVYVGRKTPVKAG